MNGGQSHQQSFGHDEILARYVLRGGWIRAVDKTVKPDAFIPASNLELSVTRHLGLTNAELWQIGREVARIQNLKLHGSANIKAASVTAQSLKIIPAEPPRNHANLVGWPPEKPAQKVIAQALASVAVFSAIPVSPESATQ